jgi:DNA repair protein RecO (recombination protein O)
MALQTTEAFVLRTYSLAEADKICVFLTKEMGKVRGVAHGARKVKSRFGSALEPFTEVSLTYFQKESRELVSISTCEIVRSHFYSAARDPETAGAFSYMAELLTEFLPDNEPNERLYRLVGAVLEAIEKESDLTLVLRYFESWVLRFSGFFADMSRCSLCGEASGAVDATFLTAEGAPRCRTCSGGRGLALDPALRRVIKDLFGLHPTAFSRSQVHPDQVAQLGGINYQIIRHALERDLRSYVLLKQYSAV